MRFLREFSLYYESKKIVEWSLIMEQKFIQLLLTLNSITQKVKCLSAELEKLTSQFIDEDFDQLFIGEQLSIVDSEDYE